jgi:ACS family hexuronate transporter-like MFS transporter
MVDVPLMEPSPPARPAKSPINGLRWYIVGLLCLASELNYFDRQTLSVLAQTIQDDLHLTTVQYADITSWFLVSYTVMYLVSGRIIDAIGARWSFLIFVTGWSLATMLHGLAQTAAQLSLFRFLLGAMEAAIIPGGMKAVSEWFPLRERILATGIFNGGTSVGGALAAPVVAAIALTWGWRQAFVFAGVLGFIWIAAWLMLYWRPREHDRLGAAELALIESDSPGAGPLAPVSLRQLLRMKTVWGCMLVRAVTDPFSYFVLFWIPKYLQQERGFDLAAIGKLSWIPFVGLALGNLAGGAGPARLMRLGWSYNRSRKTVMAIASGVIPICCLSITQVPSAAVVLGLISVAVFFHAVWLNIALPAEVLPSHVVGTVSGAAGCLGGLMGVIAQQVTGWTVQNVSFTPLFLVGSVLHLTAFAIVCLMVGKLGVLQPVGPAPVPPASA